MKATVELQELGAPVASGEDAESAYASVWLSALASESEWASLRFGPQRSPCQYDYLRSWGNLGRADRKAAGE